MFRPGELDQKVNIRRYTSVTDDFGGRELTATDLATKVWCKVREMNGKEIEKFDKIYSSNMATFIFRYRDDLYESDRIFWEGEEYNIRAITKTGGRALYTQVFAERGVAQ